MTDWFLPLRIIPMTAALVFLIFLVIYYLRRLNIEINERMLMEDTLNDSELKFRIMNEANGQIVYDYNILTGHIEWSGAVSDLTSFGLEEFQQFNITKWESLIHKDDRKHALEMLNQAMDKSTNYKVEYRFEKKNGTFFDVEDCGSFIKNDNAESIRMLGTMRDISKRKKAENAIENRIIALTQPLENTGTIVFNDLFNIEEIQKLQNEFSMATGVASIITEPDGTPITQPSNFCRLCHDIIRNTETGKTNCLKSDAIIGKQNKVGPTIRPCISCGLWDAGAAITVGGKHIANWLIGQVRNEAQSEDEIRKYAKEIGADETEAVDAFYEVPSMSTERFKQISQVLFTLAQQLSTSAYQNVQQARFITERDKAEKRLKDSEKSLRITLNSIADAVIATDIEGKITRMNQISEQLTAWSFEDARGKMLTEVFRIIHGRTRLPIENPVDIVLKTKETVGMDIPIILISKDGQEYKIADSGAPILSDEGEFFGVVLVFRDVTEEQSIQKQLLHSQKMEAVGELAGGIAHDFNNMLMGILGAAELLKGDLPGDSEAQKYNLMIIEAAKRASNLTKKLLVFSRQHPIEYNPIYVHDVIKETIELLRSTIGPRISLELEMTANNSRIKGDSAQLQSAFLNLGINASHAIKDEGTILIRTKSLYLNETNCLSSNFTLEPGYYLQVDIKDSGIGINAENLSKIFDPYFTTKDQGKGTGLGLASVYGMIQLHKGAITVNSQIDIGTEFQLYFPLLSENLILDSTQTEEISGKGTILLIDDEKMIRHTSQEILKKLGYNVILAENGRSGLDIVKQNSENIDLVILDMLMPEMNGLDCFTGIRNIVPDMKVILSSGYTPEEDYRQMMLNGLCGFILKPYTVATLSQSIHKALNS